MAQYRTCPYCGDNLDPGERCECQDNDKECRLPFQTVPNTKKENEDVDTV